MALAYGSSTVQNSGGAPSYTFAHNVGSGSDRILYVEIAGWASSAGDLPSGVTYAGVALVLVADSGFSAGNDVVRIYRLVNPTANSNNVIVSWSGNSHLARMIAHHYTGGHQGAPDGTPSSAIGSGTGPSVTVPTDGSGDFVIDGLAWDNSGGATATMTADSGRTQIQNSVVGGEGSAVSREESAAASEVMDWTLSGAGANWAMAGIAVRDAGTQTAPAVFASGASSFTATNATDLTPGLPTGWAADDLHILLAARSDNTAMTTLTGWTQLYAQNNTTAQRVEVWWRRAVAGDTAPTVTFGSGTVVRGAVIIGVRGAAKTGNPFDVTSLLPNAASATVSFTDVTTLGPNRLILALIAYEDDPTTLSTIASYAQRTPPTFTSALGNDMMLGYEHRALSAAGAAGASSLTVSGGTFANSVNVGVVLAILPDQTMTDMVEVRGRPGGIRGQTQLQQVLAQ